MFFIKFIILFYGREKEELGNKGEEGEAHKRKHLQFEQSSFVWEKERRLVEVNYSYHELLSQVFQLFFPLKSFYQDQHLSCYFPFSESMADFVIHFVILFL